MTRNPQIWSCVTYRREITQILRSPRWSGENFDLHFMPPVCASPRLKGKVVEQVKEAAASSEDVILLGSCCEEILSCLKKNRRQSLSSPIPQCFYMAVNPTLVDHLIARGDYVMTPGWLATWRKNLEEWGFDQPTARVFFHESAGRLTLLDTRVNPASASQLKDFADYLQLPAEIIPVGLDYFNLFFEKMVSERRLNETSRDHATARAEYGRQAADSAMAVDLLIQLTRVKSEEQAIEQIIEIFTILFSPGLVQYYAVGNQPPASISDRGLNDGGADDPLAWAYSNPDDYKLTGAQDGFYLRLDHQDETVGVLHLGQFLTPAYLDQYLNLSVSIAPLCGLAVSNTRTYQKLEEAEKTVRREKDISEILRRVMSDMSGHLDVKGIQDQFFESLYRGVPYSHAVVFQLDSQNQLVFPMGKQTSPDGFSPYHPPRGLLENGLETIASLPVVIRDAVDHPLMQVFSEEEGIQDLLGVPFETRGDWKGVILIASREPGFFSDELISLAGSIVAEFSIAIENARLFTQVQQMAVTDSLTGINNRRHFYELADIELKRSVRYNRPLSIILADIDFFKRVNDTYGHPAGDAVLVAAASCLKNSVRETDVVGRFGGEEFIILLPETDRDSAKTMAERLRRQVETLEIQTREGTIRITVSLGVSSRNETTESLESLLDQSDKALYRAKNEGRNCVRVFDGS